MEQIYKDERLDTHFTRQFIAQKQYFSNPRSSTITSTSTDTNRRAGAAPISNAFVWVALIIFSILFYPSQSTSGLSSVNCYLNQYLAACQYHHAPTDYLQHARWRSLASRGTKTKALFSSVRYNAILYFTASKEGCRLHWRWSEGHISVLTTSILMIDHPIRYVFSSFLLDAGDQTSSTRVKVFFSLASV